MKKVKIFTVSATLGLMLLSLPVFANASSFGGNTITPYRMTDTVVNTYKVKVNWKTGASGGSYGHTYKTIAFNKGYQLTESRLYKTEFPKMSEYQIFNYQNYYRTW